MVDKIKTVGDLRKIMEGLSDDFKLDIRIMKKVPEEELKQRIYPVFCSCHFLHSGYQLCKKVFIR